MRTIEWSTLLMKMQDLKQNLKKDFEIDIEIRLEEKFTFKGQTFQIDPFYNWCYVRIPKIKGLAFYTYYNLFNYLEKLNTQELIKVKKKISHT